MSAAATKPSDSPVHQTVPSTMSSLGDAHDEDSVTSGTAWLDRGWQRGEGVLQVCRRGALSCITRACAQSPLKLFIPPRQRQVPHVYLSSYGGGLLAGDVTHLRIDVSTGSQCVVSSQASTKIYRNPEGLPCGQTVHARVGSDATLVFAPEAISPFAESRYMQTQRFDIARGGNLVLCDWVSSGRYEVGERFEFDFYESRQSVYYAGRHVLEDAIRLDPKVQSLAAEFCLGRYNCIGLLVIVGDRFQSLIDRVLRDEAASSHRVGDTFVVAQPIEQGVMIRLLSTETQPVRQLFENWLADVDANIGTRIWVGKQ